MPKQKTVTTNTANTKTGTKARPVKTPVKSPKVQAPATIEQVPAPGRVQTLKNILTRASISPVFAKWYAIFAVAALLVTTVFWALQSAHLQLSNADQLVNPYLFDNASTFHGAVFSSVHSFLLKWPFFWLIKYFGYTSSAYVSVTVGVVLLTVGGLAFAMYRIERRPLIFGTLCLALASILLLVPAQPYAGGLLPVNMAMVATRNLEYLLYICSLVLIIRSPNIKSWRFWAAAGCMGLLVASDRLYLVMSVGGALLALVAYALNRGWRMVSLSASWLVAGLVSAAGAVLLLWLLQANRLTHIAQAGSGPFSLAKGVHGAVLGALFAALGILTNFGANPVYDVTILRYIPHQILVRLLRPDGFIFVINGVLLLFGLYLALRVLYFSLTHHKRADSRLDTPTTLSVLLIWTSLAALVSFIATYHYYAADARYLSIALFAVFINAATALSQRVWPSKNVIIVGLVILVGILAGLFSANKTNHVQQSALAGINSRNTAIAQALTNRHSEVLVGDYWRVTPIKFIADNKLSVMPLVGCTQPQYVLSSQAWQPDLNKHSFVYLLSLDRHLTDYPNCSLKQVIDAYGRPNASVLIAGSLTKPKELLLFYDHGAHKSVTPNKPLISQSPSTVQPVSLTDLPYNPCNVTSVMNIVAHEDDDLLFMNPDLIHEIKAGSCIRTVYVTAGDAGIGKFYWLGREQGSEAAYSNMLGISNNWVERIVQLANNEFITIASPKGNSKVSIVFLHLPDGNIHGQGFKASHNESLAMLEAGKISNIQSVDGQSNYSSAQLTDALTTLMHYYQPTEIHTQANYVGTKFPDHSDHMAVGRYVKTAYSKYELEQYNNTITIPLKFYIGYPIHEMEANVSGEDLQAKTAAFLEYGKYDAAVCHTIQQCNKDLNLSVYLARQYQNPN